MSLIEWWIILSRVIRLIVINGDQYLMYHTGMGGTLYHRDQGHFISWPKNGDKYGVLIFKRDDGSYFSRYLYYFLIESFQRYRTKHLEYQKHRDIGSKNKSPFMVVSRNQFEKDMLSCCWVITGFLYFKYDNVGRHCVCYSLYALLETLHDHENTLLKQGVQFIAKRMRYFVTKRRITSVSNKFTVRGTSRF